MAMPEMKEGGVNVTPLIDVIMCLIIFFMLVAKIGVKTGEDKTITPAETVWGKKLDSMSGTLTLNVHFTKGVIEPMVTVFDNAQNNQTQVALTNPHSTTIPRPLLTLLKAWDKEKGGVSHLILNIDADTPFSQTSQVYATIGEAGIINIAFEQKKVTTSTPPPAN